MQLVEVLSKSLVTDHINDPATLDDIVAVGASRKLTFPGFAALMLRFRGSVITSDGGWQQPMGEEVAVGRNRPLRDSAGAEHRGLGNDHIKVALTAIARLERAGTVSCKRVPPRQRGHYLVHLASEPER